MPENTCCVARRGEENVVKGCEHSDRSWLGIAMVSLYKKVAFGAHGQYKNSPMNC